MDIELSSKRKVGRPKRSVINMDVQTPKWETDVERAPLCCDCKNFPLRVLTPEIMKRMIDFLMESQQKDYVREHELVETVRRAGYRDYCISTYSQIRGINLCRRSWVKNLMIGFPIEYSFETWGKGWSIHKKIENGH